MDGIKGNPKDTAVTTNAVGQTLPVTGILRYVRCLEVTFQWDRTAKPRGFTERCAVD